MTHTAERGKEQYGLALILILASMVFIMAAPDADWSRAMALFLQAAALFASLRAAQSALWLRVVCGVVIATSVIAGSSLTLFDAGAGAKFVNWASLTLVALATPVIAFGLVRQVKVTKRITVHTMMGVLCIYLLMGLAFASSFAVIQAVDGDPFFRAGDGADTLSNFLYFSLTTITTAGLGDFAPAGDLGRSITAAEALIGQIYLVTVVAVIVANLGRGR